MGVNSPGTDPCASLQPVVPRGAPCSPQLPAPNGEWRPRRGTFVPLGAAGYAEMRTPPPISDL